jgi:hypothetical protein
MDLPEPAQICHKGHIVNQAARFDAAANRKFCPKCGSETLLACPVCNAGITSSDTNPYRPFVIPSYCPDCGKPFPWVESAVAAAEEFADKLDALDAAEKADLKATVPDLISNTPRTPLAVSRFKKAISKIGPSAASSLTQILVSVLTEEAKKQFGLK